MSQIKNLKKRQTAAKQAASAKKNKDPSSRMVVTKHNKQPAKPAPAKSRKSPAGKSPANARKSPARPQTAEFSQDSEDDDSGDSGDDKEELPDGDGKRKRGDGGVHARSTRKWTPLGFLILICQCGFDAVTTASDMRKRVMIKFIERYYHVQVSGSSHWSSLTHEVKAKR